MINVKSELQKYKVLVKGTSKFTLVIGNNFTSKSNEEIKKILGQDIILSEIIDETIVKGFKIYNNEYLLDVTVSTELFALKEKFLEIDFANVKTFSKDIKQKIKEYLDDTKSTGALSDLKRDLLDSDVNDVSSFKGKVKEKVEEYETSAHIFEIGIVKSVKDGICKISGLSKCMYQELLEVENGVKAIAFNVEKNEIGAVILGDFTKVRTNDVVRRSKRVMSVGVDESLLGRVLNSLGEPIDGEGKINVSKQYLLERAAPGVMDREPIDTPLQTGIKSIDMLIPVGKGQRELILGDRQTGKTTLAIDTILNQKDTDVICIYVAIGQKESKVAKLVKNLKDHDAMEYTIVISASASEPAPMLYLAPYTGIAIAEYFLDRGKDVLIIYDDLTKHAVSYRELSLLLRRPPGREAYPGDVFYLHSRLLERACKLNKEKGGGSITALPIIETQAGDISAYIPTNVISITDGQIFLEGDLFYRGIRPAINSGLSVSRVGGAAQIKPMKKVAGSLKIMLAQFRELEAFSQFSSDLDKTTKEQIERGKRIIEILKQKPYSPSKIEDQVLVIYAVSNGYLDHIEVADIINKESELIEFAKTNYVELVSDLAKGKWDKEIESTLKQFGERYQQESKKSLDVE